MLTSHREVSAKTSVSVAREELLCSLSRSPSALAPMLWWRARAGEDLTLPPPVPRFSGWHRFRTWFSTEPPQSWPWTCPAAARPWPPAPPRTALSAGRSRGERTAARGLMHSWPKVTLDQQDKLLKHKSPNPVNQVCVFATLTSSSSCLFRSSSCCVLDCFPRVS